MSRARRGPPVLRLPAGLFLSALWHLLVLAVLAMAVHPFKLPDDGRPISVQLLPALEPPVEIDLRPRVVEPPVPPPPAPRPVPQAAVPQPAVPQTSVEVRPPPPPQEAAPQVERRPAPRAPLQSNPAAVQIPDTPPAPLDLARPAPPALSAPLEVQRAPVQARSLDAVRAAPQAPAPPTPAPPTPAPPTQASEAQATAPPQAAAEVQVLTNAAVVKAPVEIRARDRTPITPRQTTPALPDIPPGGAGGASAAAGGAGQGGAAGGLRPYDSRVTGGFDAGALKGLRTTLGCASPDTYRLTSEERAACLQRLAAEAKAAPDLGINIPAAKQAEYDRHTACRRAYNAAGVAPSGSASEGTSLRGLGPNPSLRDCGPGDR